MPKTALLSLKGEKIKDIKLDDKVWGINLTIKLYMNI